MIEYMGDYFKTCPFNNKLLACTDRCALYTDKGCVFVSIAASLDKLGQTALNPAVLRTAPNSEKEQ